MSVKKAHLSHMGTNLLSKSVPEHIYWLINFFHLNFIKMTANEIFINDNGALAKLVALV